MTWLGGGLLARILPSWEPAVDIADVAMPHTPVTGRKLGWNWLGSPEPTSRWAGNEQGIRTRGDSDCGAVV